MEQASVVCMRELIVACTRDGNITNEKRLAFQNVGVLLAQVNQKHKDTKVDYEDTQGELKDLSPRQVGHLRPFLAKVAANVQSAECEHGLNEASEMTQMVEQRWDEGVTANELIACCEPDAQIKVNGVLGKVGNIATTGLSTEYMLRARVRELVNYYFDYQADATKATNKRKSLVDKITESHMPGGFALIWCCQTLGKCVALLLFTIPFLLKGFNDLLMLMAIPFKMLVKFAFILLWRFLDAILTTIVPDSGPLLPAIRLFISAFVSNQLVDIIGAVVKLLRIRILLCLAYSEPMVFGKLFYPLVLIAESVMKWDPESRISGCLCGLEGRNEFSLLNIIPVSLTNLFFDALACFEDVPLLASVAIFLHVLKPGILFFVNLLFSLGIASALQSVKDDAEEVTRPKIVWMSLGLAKKMREHYDWNEHVEPQNPNAAPPPQSPKRTSQNSQEGLVLAPLPEWKEDGSTDLFS